jgi:hypothetical protein
VDLRAFLATIAATYAAADGFDTPAQALLESAKSELAHVAPMDYLVKASGGQRPLRTTDTPWIGFFDPEETTSPMNGLYVVWILQPNKANWTLSVNMGTEHRAKVMANMTKPDGVGTKESWVCAAIAQEAAAIRAALPARIRERWAETIDLQSSTLKSGMRQRRYEAGAILAKTYPSDSLPSEEVLRKDLDELCLALQECVAVKQPLAALAPEVISTASASPRVRREADLVFAPGTDKPIYVEIDAPWIRRMPRHESGLRRYGEWLMAQSFSTATNVHPRDLTVVTDREWVVEYKVVYGDDVTGATRDALSQLKEYRYFLYPPGRDVGLLAVFSRAVGARRVDWLNSEGIAVAWSDGEAWRGCPLAVAAGLGTPA